MNVPGSTTFGRASGATPSSPNRSSNHVGYFNCWTSNLGVMSEKVMSE